LFDTVDVEVLAATFQTKQLGEGMLTYRLTEDRRLLAPCGVEIAYHGLLHLIGEDGAEFMAIFTHGELESFDPIAEEVSEAYRCLGGGVPGAGEGWSRPPPCASGSPPHRFAFFAGGGCPGHRVLFSPICSVGALSCCPQCAYSNGAHWLFAPKTK